MLHQLLSVGSYGFVTVDKFGTRFGPFAKSRSDDPGQRHTAL